MPNNQIIDFSPITSPRLRTFLEYLETERCRGRTKQAIANLGACIWIFYFISHSGDAWLWFEELSYQFTTRYAGEDGSIMQKDRPLIRQLAAGIMAIVFAYIVMSNQKNLKYTYTYLAYLYLAHDVSNHHVRLRALGDALSIGHAVGFDSNDSLLFYMHGIYVPAGQNPDVGLSPEECEMLAEGVDPNFVVPDKFPFSKVWLLAQRGNWRGVTQLLALCSNVDVNLVPYLKFCEPVLILAALSKKWEIVTQLIDYPTTNLNVCRINPALPAEQQIEQGKTALYFVASAGQSDLVMKLVAKNAVINQLAIDAITAKCDLSVIRKLIQTNKISLQQILTCKENSNFSDLLFLAMFEHNYYMDLKQLFTNPHMHLSNENLTKIATAVKKTDHTLSLLLDMDQSHLARALLRRCVLRHKDHVLLNELFQYDEETIESFLNLDVGTLGNILDPISRNPVIINPVRIVRPEQENLDSLYERANIELWIKGSEIQALRGRNFNNQGRTHPELGNGHLVQMDNIVPLTHVEKKELHERFAHILKNLGTKNVKRPRHKHV